MYYTVKYEFCFMRFVLCSISVYKNRLQCKLVYPKLTWDFLTLYTLDTKIIVVLYTVKLFV